MKRKPQEQVLADRSSETPRQLHQNYPKERQYGRPKFGDRFQATIPPMPKALQHRQADDKFVWPIQLANNFNQNSYFILLFLVKF